MIYNANYKTDMVLKKCFVVNQRQAPFLMHIM